jgi:hypothetical protein
MNKQLYNQIIQLIDDNQIEVAINTFKDWANTNKKSELVSSLTVLKMRYSRVKRQEKAGIIKLSKALPEYAFVIDSTLDFLNSEPIIDEEIPTLTPTEPTNSNKKTILFLASMPTDEAKLQLEKEFIKIYSNLQDKTDEYELKSEWAVKPSDLQKVILKYRPHIIHFSGHGTSGVGSEESGLLMEDKTGKAQLVPQKALENMFKIFARKMDIQIVILNACYSKEQAESIRNHIPYVIGMKKSVEDETSLEFSTGFYLGLTEEDNDVEFAFDLAVNAIQLEGLSDDDVPVLLKK